MNPLGGRQSGQVMVVFALSVVAMVAMLAVVVDGGFLYVQRRTAQTSADAGALAGARALRELSSLTTIRDAAATMATNNTFGTTPTINCVYLVDTTGASLGSMSPYNGSSCPSGTPGSISGASGVHVDVTINYPSIMAGMLRISSFNADGHATAQLGAPGSVNSADSPLIVCGGGSGYATLRVAPGATTSGYIPPLTVTNGNVIAPSALLPTYTVTGNGGGTIADQLLTSGGVVDYANKTGYVYYLKGSAIGSMGSDCGTQSNTFDGGNDPGPPTQVISSLPGSMTGSKGNNVAMLGSQVEGPAGCPAGTNILTWTAGSAGCVMWLPVANGPLGGTGNTPTLTIPQIAPFYVWCNKSSSSGTTCQEFVGQLVQLAGTAPQLNNVGITNGGVPSGVVVVHLTQ